MNPRKSIVISAPSGAGKSTIVKALLAQNPQLAFSVSACSRPPRGEEQEGIHYYFLSPENFKQKITDGAFFEWEEVYDGMYYGTLHSELERIWAAGQYVVFDVDVVGGLHIKELLGANCLAIFIQPPSIAVLAERLHKRNTDTADKIQMRLAKAEEEIKSAPAFDVVVVNDDLNLAIEQVSKVIQQFLNK
jgi:guanylate kinase